MLGTNKVADAISDDASPAKEGNHGPIYLQRVRDEFTTSMQSLQGAAGYASESAAQYFDCITMAHSVAQKTASSSIVKTQSKRQRKDPRQPKRPMNAYHLFCAAGRGIVKSDLGAECQPSDVVMELRSRWSKLPEDEKKAWYEIYLENKLIYLEKMRNFRSSDRHPAAEAHSNSKGDDPENDGIMLRSTSPDQLKVQGAPVLPARISVVSLLEESAVARSSNFVVLIPARKATGTFVESGVSFPVPTPYQEARGAKAAKGRTAAPIVSKRKLRGFEKINPGGTKT